MNSQLDNFIQSKYIAEYQQFHRNIFLNLNRMIWSISFLRKLYEKHTLGVSLHCYNNYVIKNLYHDEFELLVLRACKTFFDDSGDTITIDFFKNKIIGTYVTEESKDILLEKIKNSAWCSKPIKNQKEKIKKNFQTLRNNFIAHNLHYTDKEVSASLDDIEVLLHHACDFFVILSFDIESFYIESKKYLMDFSGEFISNEKIIEYTYLFQYLSSPCIKSLHCEYNESDQDHRIQESVIRINEFFCH